MSVVDIRGQFGLESETPEPALASEFSSLRGAQGTLSYKNQNESITGL